MDLADVRFLQADDGFDEGGLASPVAAHQSNAAARTELE